MAAVVGSLVIGVTGGIASGKSTVTQFFADCGASATYSADADARAVLENNPPLLSDVFAAFPEAQRPEDETLDRAALAKRIFGDTAARERLEAILHPAIIARIKETIAAFQALPGAATSPPHILAYEVPLLFEAGLEDLFDVVVTVTAHLAIQVDRLQAREAAAGRSRLSGRELSARLFSQLSAYEKARRADYVIRADGTLEETRAQVQTVWNQIIQKSRQEAA